ncbi:hypothetical protein CDSM653_01572 [Caldanaerobacter subterraneus subsp. pacificus DSM 12653]|uniref:Uncharacterized protein n=1 Tax=Caldanaerobacter subterraneus subsp. pacificus DSM 12653 TaxID=391606 RepID=A0A0F5PM07_9THEO|nr:hypothetical protein CDSM653_01572 [Caldanaerobacter subterraneus subsp. pacificus DSM 12653]
MVNKYTPPKNYQKIKADNPPASSPILLLTFKKKPFCPMAKGEKRALLLIRFFSLSLFYFFVNYFFALSIFLLGFSHDPP